MMQPTTKAELKHLVDNWEELDIVLNDVDTSLITNMSSLFRDMINFNQPIGNWDTRNVTDMSYMFSVAKWWEERSSFNQPLNWNTENVNTMCSMFYKATSFNQPLNWDTTNVRSMSCMFYQATSFNQNVFDKKRNKWAFLETQYLGKCKRLPTDLIRLISQLAFYSWNMEKVTSLQNMFTKCPSKIYLIQNLTNGLPRM
jgi:surface protein